MDVYRSHLGQKLRSARKGARFTQEELAEQIGVEPPTVSRWEAGIDFPGKDKIPKIIKALNLSKDFFEIVNTDVTFMALSDAAEIFDRLVKLPDLLRASVFAILQPGKHRPEDLPPEIAKLVRELVSKCSK